MIRLGLSIALVATLCACYSKYEGDQMRKDVDELKSKVSTMEQSNVDLTKMTQDAREQVTKLKAILEEATKLVTRNSADFGLQVQKLQQDLAALTGRVDEISHNLDTQTKDLQAWRATVEVKLEAAGKGGAAAGGPAAPPDKDTLFRQAQEKLAANDHEAARQLLRQFITQYPTDPRAAQAQEMHGESYFLQQKYAAAIGEFQKVLDHYPKSPQVEEAMFKIGQSFFQLHYCGDAKTFLAEGLKRFPHSKHAAAMKKMLADISKSAKNRKVCID